jgi:hypothetical protein
MENRTLGVKAAAEIVENVTFLGYGLRVGRHENTDPVHQPGLKSLRPHNIDFLPRFNQHEPHPLPVLLDANRQKSCRLAESACRARVEREGCAYWGICLARAARDQGSGQQDKTNASHRHYPITQSDMGSLSRRETHSNARVLGMPGTAPRTALVSEMTPLYRVR